MDSLKTYHFEVSGGLFDVYLHRSDQPYGTRAKLEDLPEKLWIVFLGNKIDHRRIEVKNRSPQLLKTPASAQIHISFENALAALQSKFERDIAEYESLAINAKEKAQRLRGILARKVMEYNSYKS